MKIMFLQFILLPFLTTIVPATSDYSSVTRQEPISVGRCVGQCTSDKLTQEIAYYLSDAIKSGGNVAIRLCSNERFEVAIAKASGNISTIEYALKNLYKSDLEKAIVLLSTDCLQREVPGQVATDFLILSTDSLPRHIASVKMKDISITTVGFVASTKEMKKDYPSKALEQFVDLLKKDRNLYGVVVGFFIRKPSASLKAEMQKVRKRLQKPSELKERYSADTVKYGYFDSDSVEPEKPVFFVVEIKHTLAS